MIVLFTDFGLEGPYVGQMKAVLHSRAPGVPVVDLFTDLPPFNPRAAAYLLAAYYGEFPSNSIFLCVVDPGVGSDRPCVAVQADDYWFIGPDNGLFNVVSRRAQDVNWWDISWRPSHMSASFHGRDLFAPVAAMLASGQAVNDFLGKRLEVRTSNWQEDLDEIIYIDHFGNAMSGRRAVTVPESAVFELRGQRFSRVRTFSDVSPGTGFWYENANGLIEFAVNQGRADLVYGIGIGDGVKQV